MAEDTRAVVMLGQIPHSIHPDRDAAHEYVENIDEVNLEGVSIIWPVPVKRQGAEP